MTKRKRRGNVTIEAEKLQQSRDRRFSLMPSKFSSVAQSCQTICNPVNYSNQSILKEIGPGCSLERLLLKLKLQYFGHLMRRADSFEKTLMLGKIEGRRRRG